MTWRPGKADNTGVQRDYLIDDDGSMVVRLTQDVGAALDRNKAMRNHNDGYTESRDHRRVAHIPDAVGLKWLIEEGWWFRDPQYADRLLKKLMDPDWSHLRTADGRLALDNGVIR